jgi:dienelactone hydrolase
VAEVLVFHHALGLTPGVVEFANELRAAGHTVHTPDLFDGRTFQDIPSGVAHARSIGFDEIIERGRREADKLPPELVYVGVSLGVMPAEMLAMNRPGARGASFFYGCIPLEEFGGKWPDGVPMQVHVMEEDDDGDVEFAREVVKAVAGAELFLYPGNRHLFADSSVADQYDERAAKVARGRLLDFLSTAG